MIIGFVGGSPDRRKKLGDSLSKRYDLKVVQDRQGLDETEKNDYVVLDVSSVEDGQFLHDEKGARLIYLKSGVDPTIDQDLQSLCSFTISTRGSFKRVRHKLEMTLMGCC